MPPVAHQGGWDELLILLAPVLVFVALRLLERRRRGAPPRPSAEEPGGEGTEQTG